MRPPHSLAKALISFLILLTACTPQPAPPPSPIFTPLPTFTPAAPPTEITTALVSGVWNPYGGPVTLDYDPEEWQLLIGGERILFVYEGNEGLVHQNIDACILSLLEGHGIPNNLDATTMQIPLGEHILREALFTDEDDLIVFGLYTVSGNDFVWGFLLGGPDPGLDPACIVAGREVLNTFTYTP